MRDISERRTAPTGCIYISYFNYRTYVSTRAYRHVLGGTNENDKVLVGGR